MRQPSCTRLEMSSPFPGLDPWLEQYCGDVHTAFMVYARDLLNEQLPADLQARVEEELAINGDTADASNFGRTDVAVVEPEGRLVASAEAAAGAVATPVLIPLDQEPQTWRRLEIVDSDAARVITVVELLSPGNKGSLKRRQAYRAKTRKVLANGVNLVEIDMVRSRTHVVRVPEERLSAQLQRRPLICVRRTHRPAAEVYVAPLREPLPAIGISLRPTDTDVVLPLQSVFDEIYRKGRYSRLDYRLPPKPKLTRDDDAWADEILRRNGRR